MASLIDILKQAGFKGEGLKMAYAIAMAESGGNAYAHNPKPPDNSYGLFQINMLGAMGPERRAKYGLSSNEDLFDPVTNAKIAYAMSNGGKNWKAWSTYLYGNYKAYYGGSMGAQVTNYSGGGGTGGTYNIPAATVPALDKYEMAEKYGLTWATINANKEIKSLFNKAIKEGWDEDLFTAKLKNTKWWKTTTDSARKFFLMKTGDPATYKAKWKENQFSMNALAVEVGLTSQINSKGHSSSILKRAILYKMRDGWSDARIKAWFGSMVKLHGGGAGQMYGEAGEAYDQIFGLAYANGQKFSRSWYENAIQDVMAGKKTLQHLEATVRQQAASKYYAFANQIRAGQNALDLAQPYIQAVAQILELPITDIDLLNPHVNKAMTAKVAPGQKPGTQYSLWQFENDLRSDPLWRKTNNAREGMFTIAHQVARDFGFAF